MNPFDSEFIVLRKTPFQETSLIASGISPQFGRLDFLFRGARTSSQKKFPAVELFRLLHIEFRESAHPSAMPSLKSAEPVAFFDRIALRTEAYLDACACALFFLQNSKPMLEMPRSFAAFLTMLKRMDSPTTGMPADHAAMLAKFVYLDETGYLPEPNEGRAELRRQILDFAESSDAPCPELSSAQWSQLSQWCESVARSHMI